MKKKKKIEKLSHSELYAMQPKLISVFGLGFWEILFDKINELTDQVNKNTKQINSMNGPKKKNMIFETEKAKEKRGDWQVVRVKWADKPKKKKVSFSETKKISKPVRVNFGVKKKKVKRWKPKEEEIYYTVGDTGCIYTCGPISRGNYLPPSLLEFGNCFETREQAQEAAKRVKKTLMEYHEELINTKSNGRKV